MAAPYGEGRYATEPPLGSGLNITDIFSIVKPKPEDPGINSTVDSEYPNVAIITFDKTNQFGGMWAKEKLDLTMPFKTEMYLYLAHQYGGTGDTADGMTFTLHNDPAGLNAIGGAGEGLGVYKGRKWIGPDYQTTTHGTYLQNSLVIEFDTYRNAISEGAYVDDPGTSGSAHCALLIPRADVIRIPDHGNSFTFSKIQDWVKFEITWIPDGSGGGTLDYTFDGTRRVFTITSFTEVFGGSEVYWGFTGATGQLTSVQAAAITALPEQGVNAAKTVENDAGEDINYGIVFPGDTIHYTIRVSAKLLHDPIGPVVIEDTLSDYLEYGGGDVLVTTMDGSVYPVTPVFDGKKMTVDTDQYLQTEGEWLDVTFSARVEDTAAGEMIYNQAVITALGLSRPWETNTTQVSVFANPEKMVSKESEAGQDGSRVSIGDRITYTISYGNHDEMTATILITDRLPGGVDFVSASNNGVYDSATHTVSFSIPEVASGAGGVVSVVVRVNETALVTIENYAIVKAGDNEPHVTNKVINPVTPENPIKSVSEGSEAGRGGAVVEKGDRITYNIIYLNYKETAATVVITDTLVAGVDFVSASAGGVYNQNTRTVTWTFTDVQSGVGGLVSLVVQVNERAMVRVEDYATVQVEDDDPMDTNLVVNPVSPDHPVKRVSETSQAGQGGAVVKLGDRITYDISYSNYQEKEATVIITDILPEGTDFVSASTGGIYDETTKSVTWIFTDVQSGATGTVSMVVQVNADAAETIENYAIVQVGEDDPMDTNTVINPMIHFKCPDTGCGKNRICRKTITGCKIWADNDNKNGTRPALVEIVLMRDGEVYRRKTIDSMDDGTYIFACLPVWKNSEDRYRYQIDELDVPDYYTKTIVGYNVINTLTTTGVS